MLNYSHAGLPSEEELEMVQDYLVLLRQMRVSRYESIRNFKEEAKAYLEKLGDVNVTHRKLIESEYIQPTVKNVDSLKMLVKELAEACDERQQEFLDMKESVQQMWKHLEVPNEQRMKFMLDLSDDAFNQSSREKLELEIERCRRLKLSMIPKFIEGMREELVIYSDKCMKSDDFRHRSVMFDVLVYNEAVMQRHKNELRQLKSFHADTEDIFILLDGRDKLKEQLEALQRYHEKSDRLKNRGGCLLKEAKERKELERKLLLAEVELSKAVEEFQAKNKHPFMVNGALVELDGTAKSKLTLKKQYSSSNLRLKKPFGDRTNQ